MIYYLLETILLDSGLKPGSQYDVHMYMYMQGLTFITIDLLNRQEHGRLLGCTASHVFTLLRYVLMLHLYYILLLLYFISFMLLVIMLYTLLKFVIQAFYNAMFSGTVLEWNEM